MSVEEYTDDLYNLWNCESHASIVKMFNIHLYSSFLDSYSFISFRVFVAYVAEECGVEYVNNSKHVKIIDEKKWLFAKLKYGITLAKLI